MAVNLAAIRDQLFPGLRGIEGKYPMIPTQHSKVFDQGTSKMAIERTLENRYLGLAQVKSEGGATSFDNAAGQRFVFQQEHTELGLGYAITRKAIDDNLYKEQFNPSNLGLMESFQQTKEILGANVLNTAGTYNPAVVGDAVSLCNAAHPLDQGTYANRPGVEVDLSETAIQNALIQIRAFKDQANLKVFARGRRLFVPPALEYVAARLTKTELRPGTTDNDVNALLVTGGLPDGYEVLDFLTSNFAWFIRTSIKGLLYLQRIPFETDMQVDFTTQNLLCLAYERYSFGYYNPRAIWGTFPTS
jgi:hypothetical protein